MAVFHGVGINWGVDSTIIGVNGLFQTREHSYKVDSEQIKDGGETTVSKVYWDGREEASFSYIAASPTPYIFGNAPVQIPTIGAWIQVIDPVYPAIAGYWLVDEIVTTGSNTAAVRITLKISRFPYVAMI